MIFRIADGSLINFKRCEFKNDDLYYKSITNSKKAQKDTKQKTVQDAFNTKDRFEETPYSKLAINKVLQEFA